MHILIVAPSLDPSKNVSGISAVTNFIIKNNKEFLYTNFIQGKSDNERGLFFRITRIIRNYKKWCKELNITDEQIIHFNFPLDAFSIIRDFFFLRKAHELNRKMVIHLHGGLYLFKENKPFLIKILLNKIFSWDYPLIVLSNKEKEQIKQTYPSKHIFVLPNSIDLCSASLFCRNDFHKRLDILYMGRIEPNKGMDYIYKAMKTLLNENEDFVLHFAGKEQGNSGYVEDFSLLLGDRFVYEGVVTGEKKDCLLKKCNVFLLPSFYEGLPISLLECMSFGMIPVTSNVGSIDEFVENEKTGLFVKIKDADSIAFALKKISKDPISREKMSKGAREKIFNTLNPQEYISKLNKIYHNC